MRRREFLGVLGGAAAAWPLTALAQRQPAMKHIGILMGTVESAPESPGRIAALRLGLKERGWIEGPNLQLDIRWGAGDPARIDTYAKELVAQTPDVILATNTPTARSLKQATQSIPVVFVGLADPVAEGVVASLPKPTGNVTGFTSFNGAIAGKWLQLLKEISPGIERIAVMYNPITAPHAIFLPVMESISAQLAITLMRTPVTDTKGIESAISELARLPAAGLAALPDVFMGLHGRETFEQATRTRLPTVGPLRSYAISGALVTYGSNFNILFQQSAAYLDRILHGEKPSELPVQEPTSYELIVNLKTAKSLGLEVPPALLARADEVIE